MWSNLGSFFLLFQPNSIYNHRDGLVDAIRDNEILVIIGETGSGKTTQLPRYIIEEFRSMRVGVTQPRQVSYLKMCVYRERRFIHY